MPGGSVLYLLNTLRCCVCNLQLGQESQEFFVGMDVSYIIDESSAVCGSMMRKGHFIFSVVVVYATPKTYSRPSFNLVEYVQGEEKLTCV